jgi:LmbE family N-acetylglucosaminyl deacetylase
LCLWKKAALLLGNLKSLRMCSNRVLAWFFVFITSFVFQFQPKAQSSAEILQSLQKLNTLGSVLYIAAHPDDENTRLLSYLANERKLRTGYLSITRGDGGQNLIGKEQGELLGLIRTQELLAARRKDGAEQFFTRANDFGYSKNPEETIKFWNRDSTLADMVWVIRQFKPDVIINRFPTTGEGGHGHHTASAMLALEAFEAAANPAMFPEQLKYTEVWQAKRLFWNTFNFGGNNTTAPDQLKINVGLFNPLMGKSYGEIASESRSMHKSQGFGTARQRGELTEYFKQLKGDSVKNDIFEGIEQSWKRISKFEAVQKTLNELLQKFDAARPAASVSALVTFYKQIEAINETDTPTAYWKKHKLSETEALIIACSGLWIEAAAADYLAVPGDSVSVTAQIINRSSVPVTLQRVSFLGQKDTATQQNLKTNELNSFKQTQRIASTLSFSNPYWLNEKHSIGRYAVDNILMTGVPENRSSLGVTFEVEVQGLKLKIYRELTYKATDPVKGEVYRPFELLPPATVNLSEKVFVFNGSGSKTVQLRIKANTKGVKGTLQLDAGEGWKVEIKNPSFALKEKGEEAIIEAIVSGAKDTKDSYIKASLKIENNVYNKGIQRIEYDHIPYQFILSEAEARLINIDLKKTGTRIGYIPGAGDEVSACLKQLGYEVAELTDEMLTKSDLSEFHAIVSGIRAYNTNERLQMHYNRLMDYVKNGGNLIAQYNTNNRIGPLLAKMAPYPFSISRDRVTDETAPVKFLRPQHPLLNQPNIITEKDFDSWVQERGIYFATDANSNFTTILSVNDPNDKPSEGSLIVAPYGKGNFVYTGLAFFRQLPAGVPGAYRLFVNLLSIPQNK